MISCIARALTYKLGEMSFLRFVNPKGATKERSNKNEDVAKILTHRYHITLWLVVTATLTLTYFRKRGSSLKWCLQLHISDHASIGKPDQTFQVHLVEKAPEYISSAGLKGLVAWGYDESSCQVCVLEPKSGLKMCHVCMRDIVHDTMTLNYLAWRGPATYVQCFA